MRAGSEIDRATGRGALRDGLEAVRRTGERAFRRGGQPPPDWTCVDAVPAAAIVAIFVSLLVLPQFSRGSQFRGDDGDCHDHDENRDDKRSDHLRRMRRR
jgi:hypothetical protein